MRAAIWRGLLRIPFLRRLYARRLLAFIDKSKKKNRKLPEELRRLDQVIAKLPKPQRPKAVEEALSSGREQEMSREVRRAAERQERLSGRRGGSRRPGMPASKLAQQPPARGKRR